MSIRCGGDQDAVSRTSCRPRTQLCSNNYLFCCFFVITLLRWRCRFFDSRADVKKQSLGRDSKSSGSGEKGGGDPKLVMFDNRITYANTVEVMQQFDEENVLSRSCHGDHVAGAADRTLTRDRAQLWDCVAGAVDRTAVGDVPERGGHREVGEVVAATRPNPFNQPSIADIIFMLEGCRVGLDVPSSIDPIS